MNEMDNLFSELKQLSAEIRRLQAVAESWPDKEGSKSLISQRNVLQVLIDIKMERILLLESEQF